MCKKIKKIVLKNFVLKIIPLNKIDKVKSTQVYVYFAIIPYGQIGRRGLKNV